MSPQVTKAQQFQLWASISTVIALIGFGIMFGQYKEKVDSWDRNFKAIADQVMGHDAKVRNLELWEEQAKEKISTLEGVTKDNKSRIDRLEHPLPIFANKYNSRVN